MILGDGFVHFALLLTQLIYVNVPIGLGATINMELSKIYWMQFGLHLVLVVHFFQSLNIYCSKHLETITNFIGILCIVFSFYLFFELFRALTFLADAETLGAQENRPDELLTFQFWV